MVAKPAHPTNPNSLSLGSLVIDGKATGSRMIIPYAKRAEHMAILGGQGQGKVHCCATWPRRISTAVADLFFSTSTATRPRCCSSFWPGRKQATRADLSTKLIVIEPADAEVSVGLNVLEAGGNQNSFVQIAEFAQLLKQRWHLDSFGARTEELLRNSLLLLAENRMTLLELPPLLTDEVFRARCLRAATNSEARDYFAARYNPASEGMQNMFRDAVLNKVSAFTADPHFRHILGQQRSTFSLSMPSTGATG